MTTRLIPLVSLVPLALAAADLPPLVLPAGVGVNIHFTRGHEKDLDLIAAAGFKFIRMDFAWEGIERRKGEYDWSAYEDLTAGLERRGIRALYILDYSNPLYEQTVASKNPITGAEEDKGTASPQHPESIAAFARWAAAGAKHFRGRRVIWEIWNEPNIFFWKPKPDAQQYATLALATCKAIRETDPQATILAPATSGFPWEFIETLFKAGALDYLDGVSVHPYREYRRSPETAAADYRKLRELIERYAPAARKKRIPIISGEWGYASHTKGVSLETQAAFIARQQLANLLHGVPLSIWYDWKNDGPDADEREHHFGTVTLDLQPKPAYTAVQTLTRELDGYSFAWRLDMGNTNDFVLVLVNGAGQSKLAAWTTGEAHRIVLPLQTTAAASVPIVEGQGQRSTGQAERGQLTVELAPAPKYLTLGKTALKP